MRTTIEKVRAAVVVGAALVAMIVAGFLLLAHYRAHRLLKDLPERLGMDIQKETNGFTWSQSVKGRTVFTIHAAKATQHKDERTGLEDVGIVLYGQKDGRADRIYGKQFDYDQKHGVVRAAGEVQLDLQAPAPVSAKDRAEYARAGTVGGRAIKDEGDTQPIHAVTSGLVYVQSQGLAATEQPIRFSYKGMTGQARGAAYNSGTGLTTLESEVKLSTLRDGRPTVLTAAHAELDRVNHRLMLRSARYVALAKDEGDRGASETLTAGMLVVHLAQEGGGIDGAEGSDGVELASGGSRMQAPRGEVHMRSDGHVETAQMMGGVRFEREQEGAGGPGEGMDGTASDALARFDERGEIETVRLTGGVQAHTEGLVAGVTREMQGREMDLVLTGAGPGSRRWIQQATMRGDASVESALPAAGGHTAGNESMRADVLVGRWTQEHGVAELREMNGDGHTAIARRRDGADEVSRGDRMHAEFADGEDAAVGARPKMGISLATQQGNVAIDRTVTTAGKKTGKPEGGGEGVEATTTHARAERVSYDGGLGVVNLMGSPELDDAESMVRAERLTLMEATGDAEATGAVQVTYRAGMKAGAKLEGSKADAGPIHAVAARAVLRKESGVATFYGTSRLRARLWQGGSQVEGPVLVLGRAEGTLDAFGTRADEAMPVRTVLESRAAGDASGAVAGAGKASVAGGSAAGGSKEKAQVLLVQSGRLHYVDAARQADFSQGVLLEDADGTMSSRDAVATLLPAVKAGTPGEVARPQEGMQGLAGGALERVTATGDVTVRQPGRVATGERAVYTAADGVFVMTGGAGAEPRVTDEVNGSVRGASLRFRSGDNSVTVDGRAKDGSPPTGDGRVHTQTKVKQKG